MVAQYGLQCLGLEVANEGWNLRASEHQGQRPGSREPVTPTARVCRPAGLDRLPPVHDHEAAKTDDRAKFQSMFRDASQRKFDVLLFWTLDRLSREGVLETLQHLNRLTSYGGGYRSFTEQYFDSCGIFKDAVIAIVATVAKQERVRISQRVRAGLETARAKGVKLGRPRVAADARRIATLRNSGAAWATVCQQTGLSKGTAQRAFHSLPKNDWRRFGRAAAD